MTIREFMVKTGVTKRKYVEKWIEMKLIPGVLKDKNTGEWIFPESARRPYRPRHKTSADAMTIRAGMVNACIKRHHISKEIYGLSEGEFSSYIDELISSDLIRIRKEDGIDYYDSTLKSATYEGKSFNTIKKLVVDCLGEFAGKISYGAVKAICESSSVA